MLISSQYRREKVLKCLRLAEDDHRDVCVPQSGEETRLRKTADGAHQPGPFSQGPFHWMSPKGPSADGPQVHYRLRRRKKIFPKKFSSTKRMKENKGHQLIASLSVGLGLNDECRERALFWSRLQKQGAMKSVKDRCKERMHDNDVDN